MERKIGEIAETCFALNAMRKGFTVLKPMTTERYDCVIDTGKKFLKVQIKTTHKIHKSRSRFQIMLSSGRRNVRHGYKKDEVDIFALYLKPVDTWYILPFDAVKDKRCLTFNQHGGSNQFPEYREAWSLIS